MFYTKEDTMPYKELECDQGETLHVMDVDGYILPAFERLFNGNQEEEFRNIRNWKLRPDDIFICAYPKAGTHWFWEITSMLLNQSADRVKLIKDTSMMEAIPEKTFDNIKSPRVLNTHIAFHLLPKDVLAMKTKIIFINRNPKDSCVSFFNHHKTKLTRKYDGEFKNYFHRYLNGKLDYGSWFDYTLEWEKVIKDNPDHPFLVLSYEDMKIDTIKEMTRLSEFLGLQSDLMLLRKIRDACDFETMKREKDYLENLEDWRNRVPGMFRKGQVDDWKNWFTVAQKEEFDNVCRERMKGSSFASRYYSCFH